jgi:hypothetical protein
MEPFAKHSDQPYEHRDITPTEEQLLAMALANLGEYITENSPHYVLIEDPRNEEDYDSWTYGMEVLPQDHTWHSDSIEIDVSPSNADMAE